MWSRARARGYMPAPAAMMNVGGKKQSVARLPEQSHLKRPERIAAGKRLRRSCSRRSHGEWNPTAHRPDPVELLIADSHGRMEDLIPLRYGRMITSPFAFYRGAGVVMAHDLSSTPATGLTLQACGDCHLLNFGGFATPERRIVFDINDFDETTVAPWEWDVKRLTASVVIAAQFKGFSSVDCRHAAWLCAQAYRESVTEVANAGVLESWYSAIDMEQMIANKEMRGYYEKKVRRARIRSSHEVVFEKLACTRGPHARIREDPPLIFHAKGTRQKFLHNQAIRACREYLRSLPVERHILIDRYRQVDEAYKVVGVGSVGLLCGIALFISNNDNPLFLQFKQARQSLLEPYAGVSQFAHHGQRVVVGQRIMQAASDIFLGWMSLPGNPPRHFYMRQLRDAKINPAIERMNLADLNNYATQCGRALGKAHSRSGDAAMLSGYMGKSARFEDALADFAIAYADQNERDYSAFLAAARSGRITAQKLA
jgi:uncharacterized protein (DUF2252 family)